MAQLVEPPKISRPNSGPRGSKYVTPEQLAETVTLLSANVGTGWVGGLFEPVDTIIKARGAILRWRAALAKEMGLPQNAFATRVWQDGELYHTAIALKSGVEIPAQKAK